MNRVFRLERILRATHRQGAHATPPPGWEERVMERIARMESQRTTFTSPWFDRLFWRLVPAMALLLLVLGAMALKTSPLPQALTWLPVQDPVTLAVVSIFGV